MTIINTNCYCYFELSEVIADDDMPMVPSGGYMLNSNGMAPDEFLSKDPMKD